MKLKMLLLSALVCLGSSGLLYARGYHHHHYHQHHPHYFSHGRLHIVRPYFPRPRAYVYQHPSVNSYPRMHCHDGIC